MENELVTRIRTIDIVCSNNKQLKLESAEMFLKAKKNNFCNNKNK